MPPQQHRCCNSDVPEDLARYIEQRHADLVTTSTQGKSSLSSKRLIDLAQQIAGRSFAPVLLEMSHGERTPHSAAPT
jgi:hypothetical protein